MFPISRPMTCAGLAAALVAFSVAVQAQPAADASAQIRRTSYGVPHIVAKDERGLAGPDRVQDRFQQASGLDAHR